MGDLGTTSLLYSARPGLRLDGAEQPELEAGLMALVVEEDSDGMARCEATFGNWGTIRGTMGFPYFDRTLLEFGKRIEISIGSDAAAARVFEGRITALEGRFPKSRPPEILVLAEDRLQDLRQTRRSRVFEAASIEEVIRAIASDHGLTPQIDIDGPVFPALAQVNQSDLAFLREKAADVDAEIWVRGNDLLAQARARRRANTLTLNYGMGLHELRISADLAHQCSRLVVGGWDVSVREPVDSSAGPDTLAGEVEGSTGSAVLDATLGSRTERIAHRLARSAAEGDSLAKAEYRRRARRFVSGEAVAEGDARIRVGSAVDLRGTGPLFDGAYTVTAVRHIFDLDRGLVTEFAVERPWIGP